MGYNPICGSPVIGECREMHELATLFCSTFCLKFQERPQEGKPTWTLALHIFLEAAPFLGATWCYCIAVKIGNRQSGTRDRKRGSFGTVFVVIKAHFLEILGILAREILASSESVGKPRRTALLSRDSRDSRELEIAANLVIQKNPFVTRALLSFHSPTSSSGTVWRTCAQQQPCSQCSRRAQKGHFGSSLVSSSLPRRLCLWHLDRSLSSLIDHGWPLDVRLIVHCFDSLCDFWCRIAHWH